MKKTLSVLVMAAIMLGVFFCIPVNAATLTVKQSINSGYMTNTNGRVQIFTTVYYPDLSETNSVPINNSQSGSELYRYVPYTISLLIQCRVIAGTNGQSVVFDNLNPVLNYTLPSIPAPLNGINLSRVVNITNHSEDLQLVYVDGAGFALVPSPDWTYNNRLIVDENNTVCCFAEITMYALVYAGGQTVTMPTYSATTMSNVAGTYVDALPLGSGKETHNYLNQIIDIITSSSENNSQTSSDSNTLKNQSDSVHSQEASYYAQNSQAIQATGLSNYQFDASAVSGLTGVRGDFLDVWNALGGWNAVYIFSLTLGLALTILRHSPSAISSAIKRKRYNGNE